jgi:exopolysaccharide biosynthesis protein
MKRLSTLCILALVTILPVLALAQPRYNPTAEDLEWTSLETGLEYTHYHFKGKSARPNNENRKWEIPPVHVHIIKANLKDSGLSFRSLRPLGRSMKLEEIVETFREGGVNVRAALNGDYFAFTQAEKDPLGLHISGGQILWYPANTTSLALTEYNNALMDRFSVNQSLEGADGFKLILSGANRKANKEESVIYSGYYLGKTVLQQGCTGLLLERKQLAPMLDNDIAVTVKAVFPSRKVTKLAPKDLAVVTCGAERVTIKTFEPGTQLILRSSIAGQKERIIEAISGGPRVLRDGNIVKEMSQEGFTLPLRLYIPRPHPRSAVGISSDGKTVFLLAAEGRMKRSSGLSAEETASILKTAGASDAMLFDGGGSVALLGPAGYVNVPHNRRQKTVRDLANTLAIIRFKKK